MKEIRGIIAEYDHTEAQGEPIALATVYDVKGSSYRRTGARMLIKDDGNWFGGISGGCIEGNALKQARLAKVDGQARLVTYDTSNDEDASIGVSLGCNGVISVIITPLSDKINFHPINKLRQVIGVRHPVVLATVLESKAEEVPAGSVLNEADIESICSTHIEWRDVLEIIPGVIEKRKSKLIETGSFKLFLEIIEPEIQLVVMGGNYDVLPILAIAENLGWQKTIISNPKRLYQAAFKLADNVFERFEEANIDKHTVAIIMSHDYNADLNNLKSALESELEYIGLLGPAVRRNDMIRELLAKGIKVDEEGIFGPAGLDLGAIQPEEIAVSILAEIIAVQRKRSARSLRERKQPIHDREIDSRAEVI